MKSLKQNTTYQILKLRLELIKITNRERLCIKKYGYGVEAKKFKLISKDINEKLDAIEQDLTKRYNSLELTSGNLEELQEISNSLLQFKDFDETLFLKVVGKITELTAIKDTASKHHDFKTARDSREETHLLKEYLKKHKRHLAK
ncbi:MAG: hypothetical protein RL308_2838 [Bacteroidota bacterium]|jgi:uncharacterized protein YfbU (UPF0304 family)